MDQRLKLSVIIPVLKFESKLSQLLETIESHLTEANIPFEILVSVAPNSVITEQSYTGAAVVVDSPTTGRSHQLNLAAEHSTGEWLLFIHADSVLEKSAIDKTIQTIESNSSARDSLYYFWLRFESDGPAACLLNSFFANLRSKFLKLPFGDQGFLLTREAFFRLGLFPHNFISGEDHALIQKAKKRHFSITPMNAWIKTSARKYQDSGWIKVTARHLYLTAKQEVYREDTQ